MEKDLFNKIVQRYPDSSAEEAREVLTLKESFPYSQLLHALSARLTKEHGFSNQNSELQLAAVYAADRSVLKKVMTEDLAFEPATILETTSTTIIVDVQEVPAQAPSAQVKATDVPTEDLAETVIHDLERLSELKHHFEEMFIDVPVAPTTQVHIPVAEKAVEKEEPTSESAEQHVHSGKSKKERIIEIAKAMQEKSEAEPEAEAAHDHTELKPRSRRKKKDSNGEELIEEIVSTKDEIAPENDKQKEQLQIIEQFIKTQPSIVQSREKVLPPPSGDLTTIKTGEFGDNVVSETLVEILLKQGKKDKAIEVLKKLIWKFPQKKTYFAAQIEELKK